jgi:hypothetical protein
MRHWNFLSSFRGFPPRRYSMNDMKNFSGIISIAAMSTNTNRHILKNHKAISVLECLTLNKTRLNRSFAVLAWVSVHKASPQNPLLNQYCLIIHGALLDSQAKPFPWPSGDIFVSGD